MGTLLYIICLASAAGGGEVRNSLWIVTCSYKHRQMEKEIPDPLSKALTPTGICLPERKRLANIPPRPAVSADMEVQLLESDQHQSCSVDTWPVASLSGF